MMKFKMISLVLVMGFLMALPVFAAMDSSNQNSNSQTQSNESMAQSKASFDFHAKDLMGKEIKDQKGDSLGKVEDVIFGQNGRADFVVLSRGGVFEGKYTPIPFKTFTSSTTNLKDLKNADNLKSTLSKAKLDNAPTFSGKNWDIATQQDKICSYYGPGQCAGMQG